jgi:hypothetical protein
VSVHKVFPAANDTVVVEATASEKHSNSPRRMGPKVLRRNDREE